MPGTQHHGIYPKEFCTYVPNDMSCMRESLERIAGDFMAITLEYGSLEHPSVLVECAPSHGAIHPSLSSEVLIQWLGLDFSHTSSDRGHLICTLVRTDMM